MRLSAGLFWPGSRLKLVSTTVVSVGLLLGLLLTLPGCGWVNSEPAEKRIIILTNGSSPFWNAVAAGAMEATADLDLKSAGYKVVQDRNDFKVEGQVEKLKQYVGSTDVAAVAISVTDAQNESIIEQMQKLRKQGVKVITIDSDVDRETSRDARFAYLGTDNVIARRELGKAVKALQPHGGAYATFVGLKTAANAKERIAGFAEGAGSDFKQVENLGDDGDDTRARTNVKDALDRNENLSVLVGIWSYNTPAIIDQVTSQKARDRVKIAAFDADPPTIEGMKGDMVDVMIVQNPYQMGYKGVTLLKAMLEDDQEGIKKLFPDMSKDNGDIHNTGLKIVVPDEESPIKADLFESGTEFFTLEAFEGWLKEKGLKGS